MHETGTTHSGALNEGFSKSGADWMKPMKGCPQVREKSGSLNLVRESDIKMLELKSRGNLKLTNFSVFLIDICSGRSNCFKSGKIADLVREGSGKCQENQHSF